MINIGKIKTVFSILVPFVIIISWPEYVLAKGIQKSMDSIAAEMQQVLDDELRCWYPFSIDTVYGGFLSDFDYKWQPFGSQEKMIVTQARHVWSAANAAMFYQEDNSLRNISLHGVKFLKDVMWDKEFGGFYDLVTRAGEPVKEDGSIIKKAYGNAFAIYGLAAYFRASGDSAALKFAQQAFMWLEKHSYDPQYGGYFQFMTRDGSPLKYGHNNVQVKDELPPKEGFRGVPPKDQNSSIHLLECFTELYKVWPDSLLKERLSSMLHLIRDVITSDKGYLNLFFDRKWTPVSYRDSTEMVRKSNFEFDHISYGHDVETAYLLLEASEALGIKNDTLTLKIARKMVDHAIQNGWDKEQGSLYDGGYDFHGEKKEVIVRKTKEWWTQVEALNSFLLMSDLFPRDTNQYYTKFCIQWEYCKKNLIDPIYKGWYVGGIDIVPQEKFAPKGSIWKGDYHTSRGLINCINRLRSHIYLSGQNHFDPINKNIVPRAKKLLNFLYSISGKKIIAGQHNYVDRIDTYPNRIKELTGKMPEIWGCDFAGYFNANYMDSLIQAAYEKYKEGYIITLMWHVGRPQDDPPFGWKESVQAKMTDQEWKELITPGTAMNKRWISRVDSIAAYLKKLQNLGVPVLWRPYHESNGVWFWWGNRKGENGSSKLYRMMFDRLVNFHKLNNLIWVWNTNAPRQLINDEAYKYEDYFPGIDYVDVLAADIYHRDYRQSHHDELLRLGRGKIIALGEIGEVPTPEILANQPFWAWFMIWGNFVDTHNKPDQIKDLYNCSRVMTHEDFIK